MTLKDITTINYMNFDYAILLSSNTLTIRE
ncbi:Uncharacterised protein [Streptococcus pseudoporcinus]|nr:Uncharacterised protein [Streptococcus pseudoporcinus]